MAIILRDKLSKSERRFFTDERGRELYRIFDSVAKGRITNEQVAAFQSLSRSFEDQSTFMTGGWWIEKLQIVGDEIVSGSCSIHMKVLASELPNTPSAQRDHVFSVASRDITSYGVNISSRPLPVVMRLQHIEERVEQRKTRGDLVDNTLHTSVAIAVAMCKITEEKYSASIIPSRIPIVVPALDGLFLGDIRPVDNSWSNNRLIVGERTPSAPRDEAYNWVPQVRANLWTYIGKYEMRPNQQRLHSLLSDFFNPHKSRHMETIFDIYNETKSFPMDNLIRDRAAHEKMRRKLSAIMDSPLWKTTVYLPPAQKEHRSRDR